jgi:hypothetical protein
MTEPNAGLDALLDELSARGDDSAEYGADADDSLVEPAYANVSDWATEWLLPTVERRYAQGSRGGVYWCDQWWAHPEGLQRIYALWREWEKARVDDSMSNWWRDHLDPHLHALTGENGAFVACSPGRHYAPSLLPGRPLPPFILALLPEGRAEQDEDSDLFAGQAVSR